MSKSMLVINLLSNFSPYLQLYNNRKILKN